jgi:hypothetical protein
VLPKPLSADTSPEIERLQIERSPREVFLRLAIVTLGEDLARKAYPEIAALDPP